jgi:S1-C subfamily serine protease
MILSIFHIFLYKHIGDIIVELEEHPIATVDNLHKHLNEKAIGKKTSLTVLRGGRRQMVTLIPGELN